LRASSTGRASIDFMRLLLVFGFWFCFSFRCQPQMTTGQICGGIDGEVSLSLSLSLSLFVFVWFLFSS
jgi:hypothetical protein